MHKRFFCPGCGTQTNSSRCPECGNDTQQDETENFPIREHSPQPRAPYSIFDHAQHGHTTNQNVSFEVWTTPRGERHHVRITRDAQGFGTVSQLGVLR